MSEFDLILFFKVVFTLFAIGIWFVFGIWFALKHKLSDPDKIRKVFATLFIGGPIMFTLAMGYYILNLGIEKRIVDFHEKGF